MNRTFLLLSVALVAALFTGCNKSAESGGQGGNSTQSGGSVSLPTEATLRLTAKQGDKYTMVTTVETSADLPSPDGKTQTGTMTLTATEENTCTKVEGTKMTWETKNVNVQATGTGPFEAQAEMAKNQEKGKTQTKVRDERNQIVGSKSPESLALVYPEKAVKVGDTWTGETELMGAQVKVEFKLDRFEAVNGKAAAVITASISGGDKLKSTSPLTLYVDTVSGWPIKGEGAFEMQPQPGVKAKMKVKMEAK